MLDKFAQGGQNWIVISLILLILFLLVRFPFSKKLQAAEEDFFDSEACRLSVLKSTLPGQGVSSLEELRGCSPSEITINEVEPEIIHKSLADSISDCWYKFGQGKVPFRSTFGQSAKYNLCLVCSKIHYTGDFGEVTRKSFVDFLKEPEYASFSSVNNLAVFDKITKDDTIYTVFLTGRFDLAEFIKAFESYKLYPKEDLFEKINGFIQVRLNTYSGIDNSIVLLLPKDQVAQCLSLI